MMEIMSDLPIDEISRAAVELNALPAGESFYSVALKILTGELDLSFAGMLRSLIAPLFRELSVFAALLREMVLVAVLGALLSVLSLSLRNRAVAELGFYAIYVITVAILLDSFIVAVGVLRDFSGNLARMAEAAVPLMTSLLLLSGNPASAMVINPLAMFFAGAVQFIIRDVLAGIIIMIAVLEIVNYMTAKEVLSRLAELAKKGVKYALLILTGLFCAILTVHRVAAPIVDNIGVRAARYGAGAIPVVGQALSSAVDMAAAWSGSVKNSVLLAVVVVIALICAPIIIKLAAFTITYKFTAALIEPICDKRVASAVNAAGSLASLLLAAAFLASVTFLFMVMVIISL